MVSGVRGGCSGSGRGPAGCAVEVGCVHVDVLAGNPNAAPTARKASSQERALWG